MFANVQIRSQIQKNKVKHIQLSLKASDSSLRAWIKDNIQLRHFLFSLTHNAPDLHFFIYFVFN